MRSRLFLGLLVCSCASVPGEEVAAPRARVGAASHDESIQAGDAVQACPVAIPPALPRLDPPPPPPPKRVCKKPPRALARTLSQQIRARWYLEDGVSLSVQSGCDAMAPEIRELVFETSIGQGSLQLDRVRPREDGDYDLLRLQYSADSNPYDLVTQDEWARLAVEGGVVAVGVLPRQRFEAALRHLRAAVHLRVEERVIDPDATRSKASSGRDFHVAYRIVDVDGHGAQGSWAGYESAETQAQWLPLALAAEAYGVVASAADIERSLTTRKPNDDDRDFFVERFVAARDRNADYGFWFIRERLLGMARDFGDARIAADLLDIARTNGEHAVARSQAAAVDVLVKITGYDPRYERGEPRAPADAAADMVRTCG